MSRSDVHPKVALVYDRVNTPHGGAENVLLALHQIFPQAPLFTSLYEAEEAKWSKVFPAVYSSFLNRLPVLRSRHRWLAMFMPLAFESLDLNAYDIIISVTSAEAKGVLTRPDQLHVCYLLTPPRYVYHSQEHSLETHWLARLPVFHQLAKLFLKYLKWWDQAAIFRPDYIIPIAQRVADRVKQYYPSLQPQAVLYPPVNLAQAKVANGDLQLPFKKYLLIISRLVSHKYLDLAINACAQTNHNLIIVGRGPDKSRLKKLTESLGITERVRFFDQVSEAEKTALYQHCQAVLMPGEEDFGLVALEANSHGKPVIINSQSGAAELIESGVHGLHLNKTSTQALIDAISKLDQVSFNSSKIRQNPLQYQVPQFNQRFKALIKTWWQTHQATL